MPVVTYNGDTFSCSRAVMGVDYIDLYDGNELIVKFGGVVDFSKFSITGGVWETPRGAEEVRASAHLSKGALFLDTDAEIGDGTIIKFVAPCACASVTGGTIINGAIYGIVDASENAVVGYNSGAWVSGAYISLLVNTSTRKAYIQNSAVNNSYTTAQTLSTEMKENFDVNFNGTPNDVFGKIYEDGPHKLGDITLTTRSDKAAGWVLCNGAYFSAGEYPDYAAVCPDQISLLNLSHFLQYNGSSSSSAGEISSVIEAAGYQVALLKLLNATTGAYELYVAYSTDWFETCTSYKISTVFGSGDELSRAIIRYVNGTWLLAMLPGHSYADSLYTYCNADVTDVGGWTPYCVHATWDSLRLDKLFDAWYDSTTGQVHIACAGRPVSTDTAQYPYVLSLSSAVATSVTFIRASETNGYWCCFRRDDGKLAFFGRGGAETYGLLVASSNGLAYAWTTRDISNVMGGTLPYFRYSGYRPNVKYHAGRWYVTGSYHIQEAYGSSTRIRYHAAVMFTTDLDAASWVLKYSTEINSLNENDVSIRQLVFGRDYYVGVTSYAAYNYGTNIVFIRDITDASTWELVDLSDVCNAISSITTSSATFGGDQHNDPVVTSNAILFFASYNLIVKIPLYALPYIDIPNCNAYIKVAAHV